MNKLLNRPKSFPHWHSECRFIPLEEAEGVISSNGSTLPVRVSGQGLPQAKSSPAPPGDAASKQEPPEQKPEKAVVSGPPSTFLGI